MRVFEISFFAGFSADWTAAAVRSTKANKMTAGFVVFISSLLSNY